MGKAQDLLELLEKLRGEGLTLYDLYKNTDLYDKVQSKIDRIPPPHQHLRIIQWKFIPRVGMKSLTVTALVEPGTPGVTTPRKTAIQFTGGFEFVDRGPKYLKIMRKWARTGDLSGYKIIPHEVRPGVTKFIPMTKIDAKTTRVQVRCSCEDFYYRFGWYLWQRKAIYGRRPKPYRRKTTYWPSVNFMHIPAMCKHLWNLVKALKEAGFIVGLPPMR